MCECNCTVLYICKVKWWVWMSAVSDCLCVHICDWTTVCLYDYDIVYTIMILVCICLWLCVIYPLVRGCLWHSMQLFSCNDVLLRWCCRLISKLQWDEENVLRGFERKGLSFGKMELLVGQSVNDVKGFEKKLVGWSLFIFRDCIRRISVTWCILVFWWLKER